ncbi:MAG: hypothetical protein LC660_11380, partial [Desulfobacteraceae bacterium]|nr:hypothetical protein [Desulfobacteraceae bacterium]
MMRKLGNSPMGRIQMMLVPWLFLVFFSGTGMARNAVIQNITIQDNPLSVRFDMTKKVPVKVIQIESKEVLIALKNASLARNMKVAGRNLPGIEDVNIESLQGDVVAVVIITRSSHGSVTSGFNAAGTQFVVSMPPHKTAVVKKTGQSAAPEKTRGKTGQAQDSAGPVAPDQEGTPPLPDPGYISLEPDGTIPAAPADDAQTRPDDQKTVKIPTPPVYVPPQREKSEFQGDISDMGRVMASGECGAVEPISNALKMLENSLYQQAFDLLDQYLADQNTTACLEQAHYLRAYAFYQRIAKDDFAQLIKAERMFQDALVLYQRSPYVPFAYTAIGMIHMDLNNVSAAEGYFNIVMQGYENYPGRPEVQFHLAEIFDEKGYVDQALALYRQVFEAPTDNAYLMDAGIGYGRALFKNHQYYMALSVFNHVVAHREKKIYESPDLLRYMGDANFELSLSKPARDNYMRLMNLFEEIADKDVLLSRVGDTYGMENREKKAVKMYELVREKFPESQGYVTASMGLARYLDTDSEKIDIYEMIKTRFPENTYARIAMMRLAEIYQKNGEYNKCIKEIEDLLSFHPRGLRYEAVKLMQQAYEALFEKHLKENDYPSVLNRYESEYSKIDRMDSRKIAFSVGTAYLQAAL